MNINEHDKKEIKGCILLKDKVIIEEQEKEIERLNKGCKELEQQVDELYKLETTLTNENDRLNNIINELEKEIKYQLNGHIQLTIGEEYIYKELLDKLKELKEK